MLKEAFVKVYSKFRIHFYSKFFERVEDREVSLTTVETFCMEIIYSMNNPTVNEFAKIANISSPNAAYKINHLIKKGYLKKVRSEYDKREYHLKVTEKYLSYYELSNQYIVEIMDRLEDRFSKEELENFEKILKVMSEELMTEVGL
jgi:DNA-binding MarR family transcriptional regulator